MARISQTRVMGYFRAAEAATTNVEKGRALEDLVCYLFEKVPGISVTKRNQHNVFQSEEIDIAFWNRQQPDGFYFLPHVIIVECKNWTSAVGSAEVSWFDTKLRNRRAFPFGILVAVNGITGDASDVSSAHQIIAGSLREGRQIVVITSEEIEGLSNTDELVVLIQEKLCELAVSGTLFL